MVRYEFGVPGKMLGSRVPRKYTPIPKFSFVDFIRTVAHATENQHLRPNIITLEHFNSDSITQSKQTTNPATIT
jgi:hypothetical protein